MAEFRLTPRALKDLDAIAEHSLAKWGHGRTEEYLDALIGRMTWLADNPDLGRDRRDIAPGYRCFGEGRHLVFHVVGANHISIIGVPNGSMDVEAHLLRPAER